jgi:Tfp pilus assembly pilus retraction ATPase PilT
MSKEEKVDAMVAYIANASDKKMVTLPEPIVFLHENGSTSTLG